MQLGKLYFDPVASHFDLIARATEQAMRKLDVREVFVSDIDESLADTVAFCEHYDVTLDTSANCVIVEAKRADKVWHAACVVLATTRADVNGVVRRHINARKVSFALMDTATSLTDMMYGGITPIGLPTEWPILVDTRVIAEPYVIIGSGLRKSKLVAPGKLLASLPNTNVLDIVKAST